MSVSNDTINGYEQKRNALYLMSDWGGMEKNG